MPAPNVERVARVIAELEVHAEDGTWNQDRWRTCVGGITCTLFGRKWQSDDPNTMGYDRLVIEDGDTGDVIGWGGRDPDYARVPRVAGKLLGLDSTDVPLRLWYGSKDEALAVLRSLL